ncbi:hypothetical protein EDC01DRAFT_615089 [Geopyxis carbonaria]|nr:hypothetical protein EDC01DRAFT_615089 [Geopyxis carbonaria]
MRQLWPGAGCESGPFGSLIVTFVLFCCSLQYTLAYQSPGGSGAPARNSASVKDPKALATVTPGKDDTRSKGLGRYQQRSLENFEAEDFVLLATVDGSLSAVDRKSGIQRWALTSEEPAVRTIRDKKITVTSEGMVGEGNKVAIPDLDDLVEWIVGPTEDGQLFFYTAEEGGRLEKLGVTVKDIIHNTPYRPPGDDKVYNGGKNTTTYAINARTGIVQRVFSTGGVSSGLVTINNKKCKSSKGFDDECDSGEADKIIMIGRTEYTISIQNWRTGELLWTIKYNEWSPNNSDMDLRQQHQLPIDNRYIYSTHDGQIIGFKDDGSADEKRPRFKQYLQSPAIRVFDVVKPVTEDSDYEDLLILPQPPLRPSLRDPKHVDRTFVGCVGESNWYAMSEEDFPYVTDMASDAKCYNKAFQWHQTTPKERQSSLVGVHKIHHGGSEYYHPALPAPPSYESMKSSSRPNSPSIISDGITPDNPWESRLVLTIGAAVLLVLVAIAPKAGFSTHLKSVFSLKTVGEELKYLPKMPSPPVASDTSIENLSSPVLHSAEGTVEIIQTDELNSVEMIEIAQEGTANLQSVVKSTAVRFEEPLKPESLPETIPAISETNADKLTPATPEKKKHPRGRRGRGRGKKGNNSVDKAALGKNEEEGQVFNEPTSGDNKNVTIVSTGDVEEHPPGAPFVLNSLEIFEDDVIGAGSQGTTVHTGKWEGKLVAVKRILTTYADVAMKEVQTLQDADYHENVVRYYCQQQRGSFLYIALELCPGSLYDVVMKPQSYDTLNPYMDPRDTLYQITQGLHHLHTLKIVHRDIKPQNILVGAPNFKSTRPRLLISDFGLCKKLQSDEYSFGATTAQHAGTVGWRAPELLQDAIASMSAGTHSGVSGPTESSGSSSTEVVVDSLTKRRATRAIDIFALGCVAFFVLSNGQHPFGERFSRELNIVKGNSDLSSLLRLADAGHEAIDLIDSMIQQNPKARPDTAKVGTHPFFWDNEKRLDFLLTVSDRFELEKDKEKNDPSYSSPHIPVLEHDALNVLGPSWFSKLDKHMHNELFKTKRRGYDETKLLDLLRAIRNKKHHFLDMTPEAQRAVGEPPDDYYTYFALRFETLLMYTYSVVCEAGLSKEPRFKKFFQSNW